MTLANHPAPAKVAGETRLIQRQADGATVGTGLGFAGALPGIENLLHSVGCQGRTVADGGAAGDRDERTVEIIRLAEFPQGIGAVGAIA